MRCIATSVCDAGSRDSRRTGIAARLLSPRHSYQADSVQMLTTGIQAISRGNVQCIIPRPIAGLLLAILKRQLLPRARGLDQARLRAHASQTFRRVGAGIDIELGESSASPRLQLLAACPLPFCLSPWSAPGAAGRSGLRITRIAREKARASRRTCSSRAQ
jgi:hypothetical protein